MRSLTAIMGLLATAAACGSQHSGTGGDPAAALTAGFPTSMEAARTVADLEAAGAPTVSGVVDCVGGDWTVLAWRLSPSSRRAPSGLPAHSPEVAVALGSPGSFEVPVPRGPRRFVAAVEATTGVIAWSDEQGRSLPVHGDIARLDLRCSLDPAEPGDETVPQGEPVTEALVLESQRPARIVSKDGGPPTLEAQLRRDGRGFGGVHTERLIRARYSHRLSAEELEAHMPMLLQLADNPKDADTLVRNIGHQRGTPQL